MNSASPTAASRNTSCLPVTLRGRVKRGTDVVVMAVLFSVGAAAYMPHNTHDYNGALPCLHALSRRPDRKPRTVIARPFRILGIQQIAVGAASKEPTAICWMPNILNGLAITVRGFLSGRRDSACRQGSAPL